jgi:hypothetical protein
VDINTGEPDLPNVRTERVFYRGNRIYSYGTHFEMARAVQDRHGDTRLFLVNGDTFSQSTSRHQSHLRSALSTARHVEQVIIPFSALDAAGIDRDSVVLLERTDDWFEDTEHESLTQPPGSVWVTEEITEYGPITPEEEQAILEAMDKERFESWNQRRIWADEEIAAGNDGGFWATRTPPEPPAKCTAADIAPHRRYTTRVIGHERVLYTSRSRLTRIDVDAVDGQLRYTWTTRRHWLGGSLIQAKIRWTGTSQCRQCAGTGNGIGPAQAIHYSWQDEGEYELVPLACPACNGRGRRAFRRSRTAKFLSGFDQNERRPSYFFCELPPRCDATTIEDAYEALKPDAVRLAEQMGRTVHRQGDIFAVPLSRQVSRRSLRTAGARFEKRGALLGTNHEATEVARMPDGTTIVRGCLYHAPRWRRPDHARVALGDGWSVVLKNTVPIAS